MPGSQAPKVTHAIATQLDDASISLCGNSGESFELAYGDISVISAAEVQGEAELPVLLIDLILNWKRADDEPLESIRLEGNALDPRTVVGDGVSLAEAYRAFLGEVIGASSPILLPSEESARGQRMRMFSRIEA